MANQNQNNQNQNNGRGGNQGQGHANPDHIKSDGTPDERYKENRGMSNNGSQQAQGGSGNQQSDNSNGGGIGAQKGGVGVHGETITADGKPDMRTAENRKKSEEQINQEWGENIAAGAAGKSDNISQDQQGGAQGGGGQSRR